MQILFKLSQFKPSTKMIESYMDEFSGLNFELDFQNEINNYTQAATSTTSPPEKRNRLLFRERNQRKVGGWPALLKTLGRK